MADVSDYLAGLGLPDLNVRIVEYAHADIGECEEPPGSNRGRYPDLVNSEFGSPLGSYWCANSVAHNWKKAGAELPPIPGSCESWRKWALTTGRFRHDPIPGAAVLYGAKPDAADHMGIVERVVADVSAPGGRRTVSIEGNTSLATYDRNGWIIDQKAVNAERLIGYVWPQPAPARQP